MAGDRGSAVLERPRTSDDVRPRRSPDADRRHRRRALTLLLMTVLVPGSAQLVAGSRRVGRLALRVFLCLLGVLLVLGLLALVSRSAVLWLATRGWVLAGLQVVLVAVALGWAALLVDAWRLGRPDRLPQRERRTMLVALVAFLLVPGLVAWVGAGVGSARSAMASVFGTGEAASAAQGRYNVLLLGGDSGKGREGLRPDSIQLVSVDAATGRAVLFGFSRETENIRFRPGSTMARLMPEGWTCGDECLLNGLYTWGEDHRKEFPKGTKDPGLVATTEAVEALSGLDVQYYVMVDLQGFASIVNAVGGLDITVQRRTPIGGNKTPITGYIEPGRRHLDGYHALWYARSRVGSTNYERMARQRCVVTALVAQLDPQTVALNFRDIAKASTGLVRTDIPQDALGELATIALKTKQEKITSVNFVPPLIKPWDYDPAVVHRTVATAIARSEAGPTPKASAAGSSAGGAASAPAATPKPKPSRTTPAVMERPGTDPDADTGDLASVCSAG